MAALASFSGGNNVKLPSTELPEGIFSLLDTDLYKLTMQCCVLKYFPDVAVTYSFTNRTPHMKFTREAVQWLQAQIDKLANIALSDSELQFLQSTCPYLTSQYLQYLKAFSLRPDKHVHLTFHSTNDTGGGDDVGDIQLQIEGLWVDTILYEIPLLALTSETYFRFCDKDWSYDSQLEQARRKGLQLLEAGCIFSEFGSRRRRDYKTQKIVLEGLIQAAQEAEKQGWAGKLSGTSNVHFAMQFGLTPVGTVAHEWFMGVAAITNDYEGANETALEYWVGTFGQGVLGIALTDTFGTPAFLKAFKKQVPSITTRKQGATATLPSGGAQVTGDLTTTEAPVLSGSVDGSSSGNAQATTFAQCFTGVRQDSGDPEEFIHMMREFYDSEGIQDTKTVVFSDSLNVELCLKYKTAAEKQGFQPTFGVGTFLTNDFTHISTGKKSVPLNIVIKLSSAGGRPAIKISDNIGKNTGDEAVVHDVKKRLGYHEKEWKDGDESSRWGKPGG